MIAALQLLSFAEVFALNEVECRRQQVFGYDCGTTVLNNSCGFGTTPLRGSGNIQQALNYFTGPGPGLTPEQSSGIVINLIAESGVDPTRKEGAGYQTFSQASEITAGTGYGIAQWTFGGRQENWKQFAIDRSANVTSLALQLDFLWEELTVIAPGEYGIDLIREAETVDQATWIFLSYFERPQTVIDGNAVKQPVPPTSGPAYEEWRNRVAAAKALEGAGGEEAPLESGVTSCNPETGEPEFSSNAAVKVDEGPPGEHSEANCTGSFTPGAKALGDYISNVWSPPVTEVQGYSCRIIEGSNKTSIHGVGRAIDVMVDANTPAGKTAGDEIRNFVINNATRLGVQRVIWDEKIWSANREGWRDYTGPHPHSDHLHIEVNIEASTNPNLI